MTRYATAAAATFSNEPFTPSSEQAAKADALVDEALSARLDGSHPLTVRGKMIRLERYCR